MFVIISFRPYLNLNLLANEYFSALIDTSPTRLSALSNLVGKTRTVCHEVNFRNITSVLPNIVNLKAMLGKKAILMDLLHLLQLELILEVLSDLEILSVH